MRHCAGFEFPFDSELRAEKTWAGSWERVGKVLGKSWEVPGCGLGWDWKGTGTGSGQLST